MTPNPALDRALAVMNAAANDINGDLTIIASAMRKALDDTPSGAAGRNGLVEINRAAQRIIWKTSGLLNYAHRRGAKAPSRTMETLILEDTDEDYAQSLTIDTSCSPPSKAGHRPR